MNFEITDKQLIILIPNKNVGKFRFKRKDHIYQYGKSFASGTEKFDKKVYLEWQIGYDAYIKDIENRKKTTGLYERAFKFKGANGKEKYPYELAEFLYTLIKNKVLNITDFNRLKNEVESYKEYLTVTPKVQKTHTGIVFNKLCFNSAITELPTYYYKNIDKTYIEAIIQKQQYASGFQPMIYFCIPIGCFFNGQSVLGWTSKEKPMDLKYIINKNCADNILNLFKVLAMASKSHQYDIIEILKAIKRGLKL